MQDDDSEIEVVVPVEETDIDSLELGKTIWNEITAGVGICCLLYTSPSPRDRG